AERDAVGAKPEKGRLRQVDLAGVAKHNRQPQHGDSVGCRLHQQIERVGGERRHQRRRDGGDRRGGIETCREPCLPGGARRLLCGPGGSAHASSEIGSPKMPWGRTSRNTNSTRNAKASLYGTEM